MLAPATDLASMVSRKEFVTRQRSSALEIDPLRLWVGRVIELESDGDRERLAQWFAAWENLTRRRLESGLIQPGGFNQISAVAQRFSHLATSLGMTEEAARMDRWEKAVTMIVTRPVAGSGGPRRHASIIALGSINLSASDAELEPGRRAEFAVADRFFALVVACLFTLLGLFAALESWRCPSKSAALPAACSRCYGRWISAGWQASASRCPSRGMSSSSASPRSAAGSSR
jgi:hypothetical protein